MKTPKSKWLLIGLAIIIALIIFLWPKDETNNLKATVLKGDFKIEVNTSGEDRTSFILFSPLVSKSEKFRTNINLIIQDLGGFDIDSRTIINLKEYTERSIVEIKNQNTRSGGKIISSDLINVNGISHQKVIYTGVSKEGLRLQYEQYYWVEKNKAYVLTLTCQEDKFKDYQAIGEKIFDSFIIK